MTIRQVGAEFFHADGRLYRRTYMKKLPSLFAKAPNKLIIKSTFVSLKSAEW